MLFTQKGLIKTDMSIRGTSVYCAIVIDTVMYNKDKAIIQIKRSVNKFIIPYHYTNNTNRLELMVLIKAIQDNGIEFLYQSDNRVAVQYLKEYKDINIEWVSRLKNKDADKHTKTSRGFKALDSLEIENLLNLAKRVEISERYII